MTMVGVLASIRHICRPRGIFRTATSGNRHCLVWKRFNLCLKAKNDPVIVVGHRVGKDDRARSALKDASVDRCHGQDPLKIPTSPIRP